MPAVHTLSSIVVDYERTIDQMIFAGDYNSCSDAINSRRFRLAGTGVKTFAVQLTRFNRGVLDDEIAERMHGLGLRHAAIEELLAFGEQHPGAQRELSIICLGSTTKIHGLHCVPCLEGSKSSSPSYSPKLGS